MASLVDPFQLSSYLKSQPKAGLNAAPYVDLLVIAFVLLLNGSHYIAAPGVGVDLVRSGLDVPGAAIPAAVLTIDRNDLIFFQGLKIPESQIRATLEGYLAREGWDDPVLLVKADVGMNMSQLFSIFEIARSAGFAQVHLAAEIIWPEDEAGL